MSGNEVLDAIRNNLFYGSTDYTKSQPDLFTPHKFKLVAPSQAEGFLTQVKESLTGEEEVLVYVHLPFCFSECLFCNSFPHKIDSEAQHEYLSNLLEEIELTAHHNMFLGRKVRCIYLGGGTPTSFSNYDIHLILDKLLASMDLSDNCNITSEAHPLTLPDKHRINGLRAIGINRISCGCQTFDPQILHCVTARIPLPRLKESSGMSKMQGWQ